MIIYVYSYDVQYLLILYAVCIVYCIQVNFITNNFILYTQCAIEYHIIIVQNIEIRRLRNNEIIKTQWWEVRGRKKKGCL